MTGIKFAVDKHTHRIVKRKGVWCFYCPIKGSDQVIYGNSFEAVRTLLYFPCPHCTVKDGLVSRVE